MEQDRKRIVSDCSRTGRVWNTTGKDQEKDSEWLKQDRKSMEQDRKRSEKRIVSDCSRTGREWNKTGKDQEKDSEWGAG
jgi:hypothetical protein